VTYGQEVVRPSPRFRGEMPPEPTQNSSLYKGRKFLPHPRWFKPRPWLICWWRRLRWFSKTPKVQPLTRRRRTEGEPAFDRSIPGRWLNPCWIPVLDREKSQCLMVSILILKSSCTKEISHRTGEVPKLWVKSHHKICMASMLATKKVPLDPFSLLWPSIFGWLHWIGQPPFMDA